MPNPNLDALIAVCEAAKLDESAGPNQFDALVVFAKHTTPDLVARLARRLKRCEEALRLADDALQFSSHPASREVHLALTYDGSPPVAGS